MRGLPFQGIPKRERLLNFHFYKKWYNINRRCDSDEAPSYNAYKARGIRVLWKGYDEFKNDMFEGYNEHIKIHGEKDTTIDRLNPNSHYCKENCRWATMRQQLTENRQPYRSKTATKINFQGEEKTIREWANILGINPRTLGKRISTGWPIEKAMVAYIYDFKGRPLNRKQKRISM